MLRSLTYLLPVLFPSWRFFATIAPSPRLEISTISAAGVATAWAEFRPRPSCFSLRQALQRLVWNPLGNEKLYLTVCMERYLSEEDPFYLTELLDRVQKTMPLSLQRGEVPNDYRIRIIALQRADEDVERIELYRSERLPLTNTDASHAF